MAIQKLKLVISDLHLGKGRYHQHGNVNPLEEFSADRELADFLEYYNSGSFASCEIELIINGDLFNFFFVDVKGVFTFVVNENMAVEQLEKAMHGHSLVITALKKFMSAPGRTLTYIMGNHDMAMFFPKARERFVKEIDAKVTWRNFQYTFDGIHIEHGNQFEVLNRTDPKRIFLSQGFPEPILNIPWATMFCVGFLPKIKKMRPHVDKVRPVRLYLRWGLINDTFFTLKLVCKATLFLFSSRLWAKSHRYGNFRVGFKAIRELALFGDLDDYAYEILEQFAGIHTVIFGHTHVAKIRQWHNGKQYINTGTWTDITSLDISSLGSREQSTFALIDYRAGPFPVVSLREWKGHWRPEGEAKLA